MRDLLELLNSRGGWDWFIRAYDGYSLELYSGTCIEYSRPVANFCGVSYISCANEFSHPRFRLATDSERKDLAGITPITSDEFVIVIEAKTMASLGVQKFTLVVESGSLPENAQQANPADA